jgi:Mrp family chromosome partitioning ATPase
MSKNYELLQQLAKDESASTGIVDLPLEETRNTTTRYGDGLHGPEAEQFNKLVWRLFRLPSPADYHAVVFSNIERGSGCTWVLARVASTLASIIPGSVCVVDANLRSPALHTHFGLSNESGMAEAVMRSGMIRDFAQNISNGNLWVVPAGRVQGQDVLVNSNGVFGRIEELRKEFDYVLVDSPALSVCSDAAVLGRACEGLVLVLKANVSRRDAAHQALRDLATADVRVLGTVLNQRTFPLPEAVYKRL